MARDIRKALWGYRVPDTNRYLDAMKARLTARQETRDSQLTQLKADLDVARDDENSAEQTLQVLQAEYFRLAGELTTLAGRSEELLERAHLNLAAREQTVQLELDNLHVYSGQLRESIQEVPQKLRSVIEDIATSVSGPRTTPKARPQEPVSPSSVKSHG